MNRNYHPNIVQIDSPSNQSKQMLVLQSNLYGNYDARYDATIVQYGSNQPLFPPANVDGN